MIRIGYEMHCSELDEAGAAELEKIRASLAKHKVKLGKEFDNLAVDEADWV